MSDSGVQACGMWSAPLYDSYLLRKEKAVRIEEQYGELLDYLAGPANRREKLERLAEELSRAGRLGQV